MQRTYHYRMWRLVAQVWVLTLTAVVLVQSSSPVITDFLTKDLVNSEDVKFNTEEAFTLPCKATGSNLKWTWKQNDTNIADFNGYPYSLSDDGALVGSYLQPTASGTYQCFVKDEKTGAVVFSRKLKVAVTVVGKFINPTDVVVKVNLGDPFKYDCPPRKHSYGVVFSWGNSDNTGHLYTFSRNSRRSISSDGGLYITYLTQQDIDEIEAAKGIRCIISGANSFRRSGTLRLEKINKDQRDSENSTLPTWSATPNEQEVAVQGKNKTLYCFASGRPAPTITWKKDGQTIVDNQGSYKISRSFFGRLLIIQNINKSMHEGIYTCEAANDLNTENPLSFNTTLKVEVPPIWAPSPPPKNISVVIENNRTLECRVTGDPAPVVTWYKDGKQLQSSEHRNVDGGKLQLMNTTMKEVGVYQCVAENKHEMITSPTSIEVLAWEPSFANVQFGPFHLLNEEEARLPCQPSTAAPRPAIQWLREGELITYNENSRYQLEEDGTLVIKQVDKDQDAVNYTCKALNFKGEAAVSAVLTVIVLPKLTTKPEDQTVMEGAMVTLHCNATGNPTPNITWTKDAKTLATGKILTFKTLRSHSGNYVCTAENGLNISVNASAAIDVLYEPSLTTIPSNQTVIEGVKATFRCTATGNPTPKITWTKDGKTLSTGETLTLAPNRTNSGEYWCSADNGLSLTVNDSAYLEVQYPPSLTKTPSDQTVIENDEVNFYCTATGNPVPEIAWIKDGNIVGQGDTLSLQANRNHSGKYWCSANNGLSVAVNASTELNVLFPPSLTLSPKYQTIMEGTTATFFCNATSDPTSKITWTKDGKTVGEGDTLSFVTERNQSGEYWCSADNGLTSTVNASVNLDVQFPPSLVIQPSDQTVAENEQVTLRCSAIGNPVPEITWIKDGQTVDLGETLSFKAHRERSGKYWCSADSSLKGSVNASAELNIQFAPSLTTRPNDKIIIEGGTVSFYCNATGNPTPKITWIKDGRTVVEGDTLSFVTDRNQSGEYWCLANNGLNSTVNASANLDVQYPPSLTVQPSDQTVIENEEVTLHCSAIGNPVPKITWIKDGKTLESGETLSFNALRNQSGKYWCSADNGLGEAVNASVDIDVQFPPSLTSTPNDQTVIEGAIATFRCTATGNPALKITWTKDGKTMATGETLRFVTYRNQSGEYWCSADNGLSPTVNSSANLDVQFAASLTSKPTDQTLTENNEVSFHCSAIGNPVPKITWIKDGKTVGLENTLRFAANRNHSGKYWCLAKNDLNVTVNASANLDVQFAPSLISKPTDQTVTEGTIATFICSATGNPTPKITWSKDGKTVATGETLSFEAFRNQSGKYWCIVKNGLNLTVNASVNLDVQFPPSLIIKPSDQTLTENKKVTLRCTAVGNPSPKITWVKDRVILAEEETLSFEVSRVQSGVYWCSADNGLSAAVNASAELNVQFVPSLISRPTDKTIIEGASVTFHCNSTGNPPAKITWIKDGKDVAKGNMLVFETNRTQSGEYWCSADNGLNSTVNASANLDVHFPPSLVTKPSDKTIIENEEVTFHCGAIGNPVPKITWIKDGKTLRLGDTLRFTANRSHSGKYWCLAKNYLNVTVNASVNLDVQFAPDLISIPTDQTVTEGAKVTFYCNATGNPTPKITWSKDGKTVATGETLRFETFRNQSGKYWCIAENGFNTSVNASVNLNVQFAPSLTIKPSDQTLTENQQANLRCAAIGNPSPKITWTKNGAFLTEGELLSFEANRHHSGKYWCSADNGLGVAVNASADLNVQFPPSFTSIPSDQITYEGDQISLTCRVTGNPVPSVKWSKDGKTVGTGVTLSFEAFRNRSGVYWCSAENGLDAINTSVSLDVQFSPRFHMQPTNKTVTEGATATFYCNATGNPAPKIRWIKDGKTVGEENTLTFVAERNLSGKYWCSAENGFNATVETIVYLNVQFAPSLTTEPNDQTIIEGGTVTFYCNATANPTPKITWTKDGETVGEGDTLSFVTDRSQSGEYLCSADNSLNSTVNASAHLDIQFPPSFTTKPSDQTVIENEQLTLHCAATGNPMPNITWIKDNKTMGIGDALSFEVQRKHSGKYWCFADNGISETVNASAELDVQYPPTLITSPTDEFVLEGTNVSFVCSATGNPTPAITWIKDGKTVANGDTLNFVANRNQSGKYWCSADNGLSATVNASADLDVKFPPRLTIEPSDQTITENDEVTFYCTAIGNPVPKITWIKDKETVGQGDSLSIKALRDDSGKYWCSADNGLNITVNASATLDVKYNPSLATRPSNQTIIEADNATFQCTATGNPAPTITWFKDGRTVGTGETLSFEAFRNNSGEYWCLADNGLSSTVNASAFLDVQYLPDLITKAVNQTVNETDQVTFRCAAIGNPVPKITWFKDGNTVGSGSQLSFTALRNHSGKYWCLANNGLNATVNAIAYLNVQFPPSFTKLPSDRTVTEADETTFHCVAIGNPVPMITWTKDGKTVGKETTLTLKASRNETGEYWCWADNGLGKAIKTGSHLDVQYPPSLTTTPVDHTIKEQSTVTFRCAAIGNPVPKITWSKNGESVGTGNTLRFNAERKHSGKYWCSADNGLSKTVNTSAFLDVLFPPGLTTKPTDQAVIEFTKATFHCNATGNPAPKITWTKDGKIVGEGDTLSFVTNRNQSGDYWCSADNGLNATVNASANLDVQFAPSFTNEPNNKTVMEIDIVIFYCSATGNPTPKITWIKDGKTVDTGDTLSVIADRNQSGEYWCSADNGLSEAINTSAYLDVQFLPSITEVPLNKTVVEGDDTMFRCTAVGNPIPNIKWIKDGETVATGDTLSFEAKRNHSGKYRCSVENGLGVTINARAHLDVQFPPSLVKRQANQAVIEGATASLHCNATGNPTPKITWTKDGQTVATGDKLIFATNRNQSGTYWCSADNGLNPSDNASAVLDVQFAPRFTAVPMDQTVMEGGKITLHCSASGNPTPRIMWVKDRKTVATEETLEFVTDRNQSGEYWCSADNGIEANITTSVSLNVQFSPSWIKQPTDQTVNEGVMATLHCNATGNPKPKITWTKDGITVATGKTLSFKVSRNQAGEYWCSAENGLGKSVNASAYLDVKYPASLASTPTDQTVKEGDEATLRCTAIGNPTPNITWIKAGKTVATGNTLTFQANRNDSGKYWCSAENGLGLSVNASAYLNVQFPPDVTITSTYLTVVESAIATFHCISIGNPVPAITWTKDGKTVGTGETLSFEVSRNQAGKYWCSAQNIFNKTAKASSYLDVHFKPERTRLRVSPDITIAVQFGSFVKLNCTAYSRPDPDGYKFYRDQELLGRNISGIYHLQLQRSGVYACVPYNSAGDGEKASLKIQVNAWKPSFDRASFGPFYLFKGSQARLSCKPFAEPYPTFRWFKDGEAISYGQNESYSLSADGSLIIEKVKDADSGKYTCMAQNYLGKANATADGFLLERTQIVVRPQNQTVTEGANVNLRCKATADPLLELIYMWKRDGTDITGDANIQWLEERNVLKLSGITYEETGVYTCVAYTPEPRGSEDSASAVVSITGTPSPPSHLQLTDCYNRRTNVSWSPVISNDSHITNYLIEQESNHELNIFKLVYNVTNPNTTSVSLSLPGWSTLRFRVRAVNSAGPSRPSVTTPEGTCTTPVGVPKKYPSNLRGVFSKANELFISWDPVPKIEWDAPGFYYILKYRRVNLGYLSDWREEKIGDPTVSVFGVTNAGYYQLWEFKIRTGNHEGLGPESPIKRSFSGQDAPAAKPENTKVNSVTASSVVIAWKPVTVKKGSVDGYKIYYWGESRAVSSRRRREIPSDANVLTVAGAKTQQATVTGLKPYTNYQVVVKAFNTGGEGPASAVMVAETLEGEPGPPSDLQTYPFGEFILVTWKPPKEPNGIITNYQVGSAEYNGSSPESVPVAMETVGPNAFKKLLGNATFERSYVVVVRAQTSKGWGKSARETATTIKRLAPAKPDKPTVVDTGKDVITLMYNYGVGGGWTRKFKFLYRKQAEEGGEFQETDWVDHFSTQLIDINNLEPEVYEFKTVGKNAVGTSPDSDVIEARPELGPVVRGQRGDSPVYRKDWFITLIILSAGTLLLLIIVLVHRRWKRRRSSNFKVTEHEKEMEKKQIEQGVPVDIKPREGWRKRLEDAAEDASIDSLDEYGGDTACFAEDGSFVGDLKQGRNRDSVYDEIPLDDPPVV